MTTKLAPQQTPSVGMDTVELHTEDVVPDGSTFDESALIQQIHDTLPQIVLVTAGAGSDALSALLDVSGASRTLLEAVVPYSQSAFDNFLGKSPKQYVSEQAARLLAGRAYVRARGLADDDIPVIGLACTATIATDRPKKGEHRGHIAVWHADGLSAYTLTLQKGARDRAGEERVLSRIMLNGLAAACGLPTQLDLALQPDEVVEQNVSDFRQVAANLHDGKLNYFAVHDHGQIRTTDVRPQTLLCGAFNPLHDGHLGMAQAASQLLDRPVAFELSAFNVDKPPIEPDVVLSRISQFAGQHPIYVSNAPTFIKKSRLFPNTTFIIGYDTAVRLFNPIYYEDSETQMWAAIDEIKERGCSFVVAGRVDADRNFCDLSSVEIPERYRDIFQALPESSFRLDISSTELRMKGHQLTS